MGTFSDHTSIDRILFAVFTHENYTEGTSTPFLLTQNTRSYLELSDVQNCGQIAKLSIFSPQCGLRSGKLCYRDSIRRAAHIVQADFMAETD